MVVHILTTGPYFETLKFDISDASASRCHFITSALRAGRFPCVHRDIGAKRFTNFQTPTLVPMALNLSMKAPLRSG